MNAVAAPSYDILGFEDADIELSLVEVLARIPGQQEIFQIGDCDTAKVTVNVTTKEREGKRGRVKEVIKRVIEKVITNVDLKALQMGDQVLAAALLGQITYTVQAAAEAATYEIAALKPGFYWLEKMNVSEVAIPGLTLGTHFNIVDPAFGIIHVLKAVPQATLGTKKVATFKCDAVTEADALSRIGIGDKPVISWELFLRGTSVNQTPMMIHLHQVDFNPQNGLDLLGDDWLAAELTGTARRTAKGVGYRQRLAA